MSTVDAPPATSVPAPPPPRKARWLRIRPALVILIGVLLMVLSGGVGFLIGAQRTSDACLGTVNDGRFTVQQVESADRLLAQGLIDQAREALGIVRENASAFEVRRTECDENPSAPF